MRGLPGVSKKLVFAYDIEGYGKLGLRLAHEAQQRLVDLLSYAFEQAQVAPGAYETQAQGDGGITLLSVDGPADESRLVTSLISALDAGLHPVNGGRGAGLLLRLRVGFDTGVVARSANGYAGDPVVAACRLRDARIVKTRLGNSAGNLIVVLADQLYRNISADPADRSFTRVRVSTKEFAAVAWIYLADAASSASRPDPRPQ